MSGELVVFSSSDLRGKTLDELSVLAGVVNNLIVGEQLTIAALESLVLLPGIPDSVVESVRDRVAYFSKRLDRFEKVLSEIVVEGQSRGLG